MTYQKLEVKMRFDIIICAWDTHNDEAQFRIYHDFEDTDDVSFLRGFTRGIQGSSC